MIPQLASPSVCVIDDEEQEYRPILDALLELGIGCIHVRGDSASPLPPQAFRGLRVVFTDLYLNSGSIGKTAASHTANVFSKVVSSDTAPVLVVIWSKHTHDVDGDTDLPPEDQPTQADLFKETLLEAQPAFRKRLIFTEMAKPKPQDRPEETDWIASLKFDIGEIIKKYPACDILWKWESLIREAAIRISGELTSLALDASLPPPEGTTHEPSIDGDLKIVFRHLAKEQGGPDCSVTSAHRHLAAVLAQSLADELEHADGLESLSNHASWLCDQTGLQKNAPFASRINALLLTSTASASGSAFVPGTVYRVTDEAIFKEQFGVAAGELKYNCYRAVEPENPWTLVEWKSRVTPVVLEISPSCDFHQGTRRQALLIAGVLVPAEGRRNAKRGDAFETLPVFNLRWPLAGNTASDVFLIFCSRYKLTLGHGTEPTWLGRWFRLRELPTAALRNWHSSHAARIGYVSIP